MYTVGNACLVVVEVQGKLAGIVNDSKMVIQNVAMLLQYIIKGNFEMKWKDKNTIYIRNGGGPKIQVLSH